MLPKKYDPILQMYVEAPRELDMNHLYSLRLLHMSGKFGGEWYDNSTSELASGNDQVAQAD